MSEPVTRRYRSIERLSTEAVAMASGSGALLASAAVSAAVEQAPESREAERISGNARNEKIDTPACHDTASLSCFGQ